MTALWIVLAVFAAVVSVAVVVPAIAGTLYSAGWTLRHLIANR